jgi:hypothetical protein
VRRTLQHGEVEGRKELRPSAGQRAGGHAPRFGNSARYPPHQLHRPSDDIVVCPSPAVGRSPAHDSRCRPSRQGPPSSTPPVRRRRSVGSSQAQPPPSAPLRPDSCCLPRSERGIAWWELVTDQGRGGCRRTERPHTRSDALG